MLRRAGISTRLNLMAALSAIALITLVGVAYLAVQGQVTTQRRLTGLAATQAAARTAQFDFADFNGWQTAYAFDVTRLGVPAASDTADSRKAFLASVARTRTDIATLDALGRANHAVDTTRLASVTVHSTCSCRSTSRSSGCTAPGSATTGTRPTRWCSARRSRCSTAVRRTCGRLGLGDEADDLHGCAAKASGRSTLMLGTLHRSARCSPLVLVRPRC